MALGWLGDIVSALGGGKVQGKAKPKPKPVATPVRATPQASSRFAGRFDDVPSAAPSGSGSRFAGRFDDVPSAAPSGSGSRFAGRFDDVPSVQPSGESRARRAARETEQLGREGGLWDRLGNTGHITDYAVAPVKGFFQAMGAIGDVASRPFAHLAENPIGDAATQYMDFALKSAYDGQGVERAKSGIMGVMAQHPGLVPGLSHDPNEAARQLAVAKELYDRNAGSAFAWDKLSPAARETMQRQVLLDQEREGYKSLQGDAILGNRSLELLPTTDVGRGTAYGQSQIDQKPELNWAQQLAAAAKGLPVVGAAFDPKTPTIGEALAARNPGAELGANVVDMLVAPNPLAFIPAPKIKAGSKLARGLSSLKPIASAAGIASGARSELAVQALEQLGRGVRAIGRKAGAAARAEDATALQKLLGRELGKGKAPEVVADPEVAAAAAGAIPRGAHVVDQLRANVQNRVAEIESGNLPPDEMFRQAELARRELAQIRAHEEAAGLAHTPNTTPPEPPLAMPPTTESDIIQGRIIDNVVDNRRAIASSGFKDWAENIDSKVAEQAARQAPLDNLNRNLEANQRGNAASRFNMGEVERRLAKAVERKSVLDQLDPADPAAEQMFQRFLDRNDAPTTTLEDAFQRYLDRRRSSAPPVKEVAPPREPSIEDTVQESLGSGTTGTALEDAFQRFLDRRRSSAPPVEEAAPPRALDREAPDQSITNAFSPKRYLDVQDDPGVAEAAAFQDKARFQNDAVRWTERDKARRLAATGDAPVVPPPPPRGDHVYDKLRASVQSRQAFLDSGQGDLAAAIEQRRLLRTELDQLRAIEEQAGIRRPTTTPEEPIAPPPPVSAPDAPSAAPRSATPAKPLKGRKVAASAPQEPTAAPGRVEGSNLAQEPAPSAPPKAKGKAGAARPAQQVAAEQPRVGEPAPAEPQPRAAAPAPAEPAPRSAEPAQPDAQPAPRPAEPTPQRVAEAPPSVAPDMQKRASELVPFLDRFKGAAAMPDAVQKALAGGLRDIGDAKLNQWADKLESGKFRIGRDKAKLQADLRRVGGGDVPAEVASAGRGAKGGTRAKSPATPADAPVSAKGATGTEPDAGTGAAKAQPPAVESSPRERHKSVVGNNATPESARAAAKLDVAEALDESKLSKQEKLKAAIMRRKAKEKAAAGQAAADAGAAAVEKDLQTMISEVGDELVAARAARDAERKASIEEANGESGGGREVKPVPVNESAKAFSAPDLAHKIESTINDKGKVVYKYDELRSGVAEWAREAESKVKYHYDQTRKLFMATKDGSVVSQSRTARGLQQHVRAMILSAGHDEVLRAIKERRVADGLSGSGAPPMKVHEREVQWVDRRTDIQKGVDKLSQAARSPGSFGGDLGKAAEGAYLVMKGLATKVLKPGEAFAQAKRFYKAWLTPDGNTPKGVVTMVDQFQDYTDGVRREVIDRFLEPIAAQPMETQKAMRLLLERKQLSAAQDALLTPELRSLAGEIRKTLDDEGEKLIRQTYAIEHAKWSVMSDNDKQAVTSLIRQHLSGKPPDPATVDAHLLQVARQSDAILRKLGVVDKEGKLIDEVLDPGAYWKQRGSYLPELYSWMELGRGDRLTVSQLIEKAEKDTGQVLDQDIKDWLHKEYGQKDSGGTIIATDTDKVERFLKRKNIPEPVKELLGRMHSPALSAAKGIYQLKQQVAALQMRRYIGAKKQWVMPKGASPDKWAKEVGINPDDMITLKNRSRYGSLDGRVVHPDVADYLHANLAMHDVTEGERLRDSLLNSWKWWHTVGRAPAAHARQLAQNVVAADIAGLGMSAVPKIYDAGKRILARTGGLYEEARAHGIFRGTFSDSELGQDLHKLFNAQGSSSTHTMAQLGDFLGAVVALKGVKESKLGRKLGRVWQLVDDATRLALYEWARGQGMSPFAAKQFIRERLYDGSKTSRLTKAISGRRISPTFARGNKIAAVFDAISPVFSRPFFAAEMYGYREGTRALLGNVGLNRGPDLGMVMRTAKYWALPAIATGVSAAVMGMDKETLEESKASYNKGVIAKMLPSGFMIPPFSFIEGDDATPHWVDLSYILPWGKLAQYTMDPVEGNQADRGFLGVGQWGPGVQAAMDISRNERSFDGKPIVNPASSKGEQANDAIAYLTQALLPTWSPGIPGAIAGLTLDAAEQAGDGGVDTETLGQDFVRRLATAGGIDYNKLASGSYNTLSAAVGKASRIADPKYGRMTLYDALVSMSGATVAPMNPEFGAARRESQRGTLLRQKASDLRRLEFDPSTTDKKMERAQRRYDRETKEIENSKAPYQIGGRSGYNTEDLASDAIRAVLGR